MNVKLGWMLAILLSLAACKPATESTAQLDLNQSLGGVPAQGFARALQVRTFQFPQDHAAHPDFRNEWWYVTGNLKAMNGQAFGYQITLFRIALSPNPPHSASAWATNQVWMAHVALTDVAAKQHQVQERFARGAAGLAGQTPHPFKVWLEDWQILGQEKGDFPWQLKINTADFALDFTLSPLKPAVLQGEQGLSQKSAEPGNASYYYSFPRLLTTGLITQHGKTSVVQGESWLDREWSTSALGNDQAGWDWFSLQLQDGHDLMFYRLRKKSGESDVHSAGKWIAVDGSAKSLKLNQVKLTPLRYWQANTGARYPVAWDMHLPEHNQHWRVEALVDDQLMTTSVSYWEGAVRVIDNASGKVIGQGYLELSGYEK